MNKFLNKYQAEQIVKDPFLQKWMFTFKAQYVLWLALNLKFVGGFKTTMVYGFFFPNILVLKYKLDELDYYKLYRWTTLGLNWLFGYGKCFQR